jgi:hypothetical protein
MSGQNQPTYGVITGCMWCMTVLPHNPASTLHRVQDPFKSLIVQAKGGVVIDEMSIFQAAEKE